MLQNVYLDILRDACPDVDVEQNRDGKIIRGRFDIVLLT
jgi:hypothetical protein